MFKILDKLTCDKSYLPFKINEELGNCVRNHGAQAVLSQISRKYQQYTFAHTTVNNWKPKFRQKELGEPPEKFKRPSLTGDDLLVKIQDAFIRLEVAIDLVLRKLLVSIGMLKAIELNNLLEFGGSITLTSDWVRDLKSAVYVKWKGTNGKVDPSLQFLIEEKFIFQKKISTMFY